MGLGQQVTLFIRTSAPSIVSLAIGKCLGLVVTRVARQRRAEAAMTASGGH